MQAHAIGKSSLHAFTPVANYGAAASGGGSAGYNRGVATDYRLKHHAKSKRKPLHMQAAPKTAPTAPAGGAGATAPASGGGAAKQPMGRP
jgi:hypothetical protein